MEEYTIQDLRSMMINNEITARNLVEQYLKRIKEIDQQGPKLNSIIVVNPNILETADELDNELKNDKIRGPLHGIPVILKDNIEALDKMSTTAGSLSLKDYFPTKDAFLVKKLKEAGAIILGKANLSEWANFRSTRSTSGWSSFGGQTRNPYALDRNPCGSSSGSAVAVAANLCSVAVGTETDGSILCPSNVNSLVGIKPTVGLVSRSGIIPIAHTHDTAGPIARTVADAVTLLGAMIGEDPSDGVTTKSLGKGFSDYTQFLDKNGLNNTKIGVLRNKIGIHDKVDQVFVESLEKIKILGASLIDPVEIALAEDLGDTEYEVLLYEFKTDLNKYLGALPDNLPIHSLSELIDFNEKNQDKIMPYFKQEHLIKAEEKGNLETEEYKEALKKYDVVKEKVDEVFQKHELDALLSPTGSPAWFSDLINGDHYMGIGNSQITAVIGYPAITVPAGYIHGLPVGISFIGKAFQESTLIKLAYGFEQSTKVRKPPTFLATIQL
ncbi:MAG: amidase [Candidatus Hodarchaeales archaeon]|jgi:amidase